MSRGRRLGSLLIVIHVSCTWFQPCSFLCQFLDYTANKVCFNWLNLGNHDIYPKSILSIERRRVDHLYSKTLETSSPNKKVRTNLTRTDEWFCDTFGRSSTVGRILKEKDKPSSKTSKLDLNILAKARSHGTTSISVTSPLPADARPPYLHTFLR